MSRWEGYTAAAVDYIIAAMTSKLSMLSGLICC